MDDLALLRELSDNPELYMEDDDRELLQSNMELLDVSKANSITLYGSDIQKKMDADTNPLVEQNNTTY